MTPESALLEHLRSLARAYPEAYEESPWGDLAAKVRGKVFAFYGEREGSVHLTVKLPQSRQAALEHPNVEPTGYGLGKSGWVSATLDPAAVDRPMLDGWIDESYRAVAPKTLSRAIPEDGCVPQAQAGAPAVPDDARVVVVISDDPLRANRCVHGLAVQGLRGHVGTTVDLTDVVDVPAVALLIDLGRSPSAALETAAELAMIHFDGVLCLAGIRDAKNEAAVRDLLPGAAIFSRKPPGDPTVLKSLFAAL